MVIFRDFRARGEVDVVAEEGHVEGSVDEVILGVVVIGEGVGEDAVEVWGTVGRRVGGVGEETFRERRGETGHVVSGEEFGEGGGETTEDGGGWRHGRTGVDDGGETPEVDAQGGGELPRLVEETFDLVEAFGCGDTGGWAVAYDATAGGEVVTHLGGLFVHSGSLQFIQSGPTHPSKGMVTAVLAIRTVFPKHSLSKPDANSRWAERNCPARASWIWMRGSTKREPLDRRLRGW